MLHAVGRPKDALEELLTVVGKCIEDLAHECVEV